MYIIGQGGSSVDTSNYNPKLALGSGVGCEIDDTFSVEVKFQNIDYNSWYSSVNLYVDINESTFTPYFSMGVIISDYTKIRLVFGIGARIKLQDDNPNIDLGYRYYDDINAFDRNDGFFQILVGALDRL